ncbi:MAG: hypothetical protein R2751_16175 [Bacteroidales bacterium]
MYQQSAFLVGASNISGVAGTLALLNDAGDEMPGLTDNGDNTAWVNPERVDGRKYTVRYEYVDEISLELTRTFVVETIRAPAILGVSASYCQNEEPVHLLSGVEGAILMDPVFWPPIPGITSSRPWCPGFDHPAVHLLHRFGVQCIFDKKRAGSVRSRG